MNKTEYFMRSYNIHICRFWCILRLSAAVFYLWKQRRCVVFGTCTNCASKNRVFNNL